MRPRISIRGLVRPSVGPSVGRSVGNQLFSNSENVENKFGQLIAASFWHFFQLNTSILEFENNWLPTDGPTDGPTDWPTDGQTLL